MTLAALSSSHGRQAAKLDQTRLFLVERQAKLRQPVLEVHQHPPRIALEDAGLEPHPDEPEHARVGNPEGQHSQRPLVVNRIERPLDRLPTTAAVISMAIPFK